MSVAGIGGFWTGDASKGNDSSASRQSRQPLFRNALAAAMCGSSPVFGSSGARAKRARLKAFQRELFTNSPAAPANPSGRYCFRTSRWVGVLLIIYAPAARPRSPTAPEVRRYCPRSALRLQGRDQALRPLQARLGPIERPIPPLEAAPRWISCEQPRPYEL